MMPTVQTVLTEPAADGRPFVKVVFRRVLEKRGVAHVNVSRLLVAQLAVFPLRPVRRGPAKTKLKISVIDYADHTCLVL